MATLNRIEWFLAAEKDSTFTLNLHSFDAYRSKFEDSYKRIRHSEMGYAEVVSRLSALSEPPITNVDSRYGHITTSPSARDSMLASIQAYGLPATPELLLRLLPTDRETEGAILIMADVRAYWQGAIQNGLREPSKLNFSL